MIISTPASCTYLRLEKGGALNTHPYFPGEMHPATPRANADVNLAPADFFPYPHPRAFHFPQCTKPFLSPESSHMLFPLLLCLSYCSHCWLLCKLQGQLKCHFFKKFSLTSASSKAHPFCGSLSLHTSGKEPACQCRRCKRCRFDSCVGKIPWRRAWQPTPVFLAGKSHGQRSLAGYSP